MPWSRSDSPLVSRAVVGALMIVGLVVVLQIPIAMIRDTIAERISTRDEALAEVTATWGGAQSVVGPRLVVPFRRTSGEGLIEEGSLSLLPASLEVDGTVEARSLRRGLFTVPVYTAGLVLTGRFDEEDLAAAEVEGAELLWERASLVVEFTDPRALGAGSSATWEGEARSLLPGAPGSGGRSGIYAPVTRPAGSAAFRVSLALQGSRGIWLVPFARDTRVRLASNWPHPSFGGAWLPGERAVGPEGFEAVWRIPFLGRDYPQAWSAPDEPWDRVMASRFGADLVTPVDHYRMAERSTNYAPLFLALTFAVLWLFDTLVGVRVHTVQYLLVGAALCLFYLLELSLSEHVGFLGAYVAASAGVAGLVGAYCRAVLRSTARGAALGGGMAALYAYLFALLSLERYALLAGSLGLFIGLALVMHLTRWVDWDQVVRVEREARAS